MDGTKVEGEVKSEWGRRLWPRIRQTWLASLTPSEVCTDAKVELAAGEVVGDGVAVVVDVGDPVVGAGVVDIE